MEKKGDGSCGCPDGKYLSGTSCLDCDSSCKTCSGGTSNDCLSCDTSSGRYKSGSQCPKCDSTCQTCSGGSSNECLSCNPTTSRYFSQNSCPICHNSCQTCTGPASSDCLTCSLPGYFVERGTCQSCSSKNSTACLQPIQITTPELLEDLVQNLTIVFTPSLKDPQLPSYVQSVDTLTNKHLIFKYKRYGEDERTLTILKKKLTHENGRSLLFIQFLEKMRSNNTEYISIKVLDPWLYRTPEGEPTQKVI